eukprot:SAG11_NODE_11121_length_782_cov_2.121523_2_plen_96_part_00
MARQTGKGAPTSTGKALRKTDGQTVQRGDGSDYDPSAQYQDVPAEQGGGYTCTCSVRYSLRTVDGQRTGVHVYIDSTMLTAAAAQAAAIPRLREC